MKKHEEFWDKGYVRLGTLFDESEIAALKAGVLADDQMRKHLEVAKARIAQGGHPHNSTLYVMNEIDNIYAKACLRPEIADTVSDLFDDHAYLYHTKVPLKYPGMIGFRWHQDYYYWYDMGCVYPSMATCFIAVDPATRENGCLRIIPRSHKCGRINHILNDGTHIDSECDPDRVALLEERNGVDYIELEPGEVVLFHCNVLHSSGKNNSDQSRLAVLGCFNTKENSPIESLHYQGKLNHPEYSYQERFSGKIE
jgi:ectoine hydroxylase-related dioxygenase (phytanoyl-CoA dioxygenase family)